MSVSVDTKIIQFKSKTTEEPIYPITTRDAIIDENGERISQFFTEYNLMRHLNGTYTLSEAISKVPDEFKFPGLKIIFGQSDGKLGYYTLNKNTWSADTSDWVPMVNGTGYEFAGVADTTTRHERETGKKFYIAKPGTYNNFGNENDAYVVNDGQFGIIKYDGSYSIEYITIVTIVNDLTTGGTSSILSAEQGKVLDNKLTDVNDEISFIKTLISDYQTSVTNKFAEVNVNFQALDSSLNEYIETSNNKFAEIETGIDTVEEEINNQGTATTEKFTKVGKDIQTLKDSLDDIQNKIKVMPLSEYESLIEKEPSTFYYVYEEE